jgi:protein disulfide-isomerase-like protein
MKVLILFTLFTLSTATVYLKTDDFESKTQGKKAFVAFKAPWCGHCKKLKPEWDKLSENVEVLIGEVDCTVEKDLCAKHSVQGYPTIKYSTGFGWKKYEQGRDYDTLEKFVEQKLQDSCFDDPTLCTDEEKEKIEKYKSFNTAEIHIRLEEVESEKENAETFFKGEVQKLQDKYQKLQTDKQNTVSDLDEEESYLRYALNSEKEEL